MAAQENNGLDEFIEPEEDFLAEVEFPASEEEAGDFGRKPAAARKPPKKRKIREFPKTSETSFEDIENQEAPAIAKEIGTEVEVKPIKFPDLADAVGEGGLLTSNMFTHIPVQVKVILGEAEVTLKEVLELSEGSIISLNKLIGETLDLVINEQIIAQGEVVVVDGNYGLKITKIISKK